MVNYCKTICILALIGFNVSLFLKQAFLCFKLYKTDDSSMSVNMENTGDAEFPALTICPDYFEAFKEEELTKFNITKRDIRVFDFMKFNSTSLDTWEQYQKVTHNLQDIVEKFTISMTKALKGSRHTKVSFINGPMSQIEGSKEKLESLDETNWTTQYYQVFGRCFTYKMPDELRESQIAFIEITAKMQSLLYIHHPGQFSWIDSDTKVPIIPTKTSFLNTQHVVVYSRPTISKKNGQWNCDPNLNKGYDDCLKETYDKLFHKKLGCFHPFMTKTTDKEKYCNYGTFTKDDQKIYWSFYSGSDSVRNLGTCNAPCASIDTHFGIPDTQESRKGSIHLKLYFKQLIAVKESHVSYPLESLFAELGGYMSLILGVSFMDSITLLERIGSLLTTFGRSTIFK